MRGRASRRISVHWFGMGIGKERGADLVFLGLLGGLLDGLFGGFLLLAVLLILGGILDVNR